MHFRQRKCEGDKKVDIVTMQFLFVAVGVLNMQFFVIQLEKKGYKIILEGDVCNSTKLIAKRKSTAL